MGGEGQINIKCIIQGLFIHEWLGEDTTREDENKIPRGMIATLPPSNPLLNPLIIL